MFEKEQLRDLARKEGNISKKDVLIGAAIGGAVCTVATLLLAPKSGKELRGDMNQFRKDATEKGTELAVAAKEKTVKLSETVSKQIDNVKKLGKQDEVEVEAVENETVEVEDEQKPTEQVKEAE